MSEEERRRYNARCARNMRAKRARDKAVKLSTTMSSPEMK